MEKFRPEDPEDTFIIYVLVTCDTKFHPFSDRLMDTIFGQENVFYQGGNPNDAIPEFIIFEKKIN